MKNHVILNWLSTGKNNRVDALLDSLVILLDEVVQVLARPDLHLKPQQFIPLQFSHRKMSGRRASQRNALRSAMLSDCS